MTVLQSTNLLQWTLPDPNDPVTPSTVTCDVYFGTDPNILLNPKIVSKQAIEFAPVTLTANTVYYWKVDVYDSDINGGATPYFQSRVFTFNTFNIAPTVDAGQDIQTGGPVPQGMFSLTALLLTWIISPVRLRKHGRWFLNLMR